MKKNYLTEEAKTEDEGVKCDENYADVQTIEYVFPFLLFQQGQGLVQQPPSLLSST